MSYGVRRHGKGSKEFLKRYLVVYGLDVFKVWVPPREYLSVQALFGAAIAL